MCIYIRALFRVKSKIWPTRRFSTHIHTWSPGNAETDCSFHWPMGLFFLHSSHDVGMPGSPRPLTHGFWKWWLPKMAIAGIGGTFFQTNTYVVCCMYIILCNIPYIYTVYNVIIHHHIPSEIIIYHHKLVPSYTIKYHHIPSYTIIYLYHHTPLYIIIYLISLVRIARILHIL